MKTDNLNLSIIILSYNTKDITSRCLSKLKTSIDYCQNKLNNQIEVIVLDNGSSDGSAQMIKEDFPWVRLIEEKANTGFSKGNNIAMSHSKYPYILLLNSDVYVEEQTLYKALAYFRVNVNCDVLGCKLKYASGALQPSAGYLPHYINTYLWILGLAKLPILRNIQPYHPMQKSFFAKAHRVGWVMGAFLMFKRDVLEKTGGFDENIFMHLEEVELCKRISNLGFKIWYVPTFEVIHLHGASSQFDQFPAFLNELKGMKYYFKKYYHNWYWLIKIIMLKGLLIRILLFSLLRKPQRTRVYVQGLRLV